MFSINMLQLLKACIRNLNIKNLLNPVKWQTLQKILTQTIQAKRKKAKNLRIYKFSQGVGVSNRVSISTEFEEDIYKVAQECLSKFGYYPISFSHPKKFGENNQEKLFSVSRIIPYEKYSFDIEAEYLQQYESAFLGITQKKAGWDCFRHLEILGAGSAPLFLGTKSIPRFTMVHYPKKFMKLAETNFLRNRLVPDLNSLKKLTEYANAHLTCEAMCKYFSNVADIKITENDTILFIDSTISHSCDYLSVFNFIGLKRVYGNQVISEFPEPDYVFTDTAVDTQKLYGRGFGYTRTLIRQESVEKHSGLVKYVVISNLQKDRNLIEIYSKRYPEAHFLVFWGADEGIPEMTLKIVETLTKYSLFVREIVSL